MKHDYECTYSAHVTFVRSVMRGYTIENSFPKITMKRVTSRLHSTYEGLDTTLWDSAQHAKPTDKA